MPKKDLTKTGQILMYLIAADQLFTPLLNPFARHRNLFESYHSYANLIYKLEHKGWLIVKKKEDQKFLKLTKAGEIEALLAKATLPVPQVWDKKWRVVVFDIPERSKNKRHLLRLLLRKHGFIKLQASVYIYPYPLSREAVRYLVESGLVGYIRIMKVEEMDTDKDLRKKFNLANARIDK